MNYKQNLHTHCTYCDGKNTPEQIIEKAIEIGFDTIGFSSHAPFDFETTYTINTKRLPDYIKEINELKYKYEDKINIFCGLETDYFSAEPDNYQFDYKIGSVHIVKVSEKYLDVDESAEKTKEIINCYFNKDAMAYAKEYFRLLADLKNKKQFDIVGHFDLLTKFNELEYLIDTTKKEYRDAALEAVDALCSEDTIFEINTGAISRKYRTSPYPERFILEELCKKKQKIILTSDCHNMQFLDMNYKEAIEYILSCGFENIAIKTKSGFDTVKIS